MLLHCAPTLLGTVIPNYGDPAELCLLLVSSLSRNVSSEPDSAVFSAPFNDFRIFYTAWSIAKNFSDTANVVSDKSQSLRNCGVEHIIEKEQREIRLLHLLFLAFPPIQSRVIALSGLHDKIRTRTLCCPRLLPWPRQHLWEFSCQ